MKRLLRNHEIRYILHRRTKKQCFRKALKKNLTFAPHGGYVDIRIIGTFTANAASDFREEFQFLIEPSAIDAGTLSADSVNLLWHAPLL